MRRDTIKQLMPVLQALAEGKPVQHRSPCGGHWTEGDDFSFCDPPECYRLKPEPRRFWICGGYYFNNEGEAQRQNLRSGGSVIPVVEVL